MRNPSFACAAQTFALWIVLIWIADPLGGSDWLRFRGPNGSGVCLDEHPIPLTWSETENLKWKLSLPGPGFSSPIVVGNRVYVTCWTGYGAHFGRDQQQLKRHLLSIDRQTGKIVWTRTVDAILPEDEFRGVMVETGFASHTPVSDGKNVFAFFGKSGVYAFDPDGNPLWNTSVGTELNPQHYGTASSPIEVDGKIIVLASAESNAMMALDKATGEKVWQQQSPGFASTWSTPVIVQSEDDRTEIVVAVPGEIWGINPENGEQLWHCRSFPSNAICNSVFSKNQFVFFCDQAGGGICVQAGGKGRVNNSHVQWRNQAMTEIGTPVEHDGLIFWISHQIAHCIDAQTGEYVAQHRLPTDSPESIRNKRRVRGRNYASPVIADGKVYYLNRGGICYVFQADKTMKLLQRNAFESGDSKFGATPAVSQGALLIRSNTHLYCVELP